MRIKWLAVLLMLILPATGWAKESGFLGKWYISVVIPDAYYTAKEVTAESYPWWEEIKYPREMNVYYKDGKLVGDYVDQVGYACTFDMVALVNDGQDLIFTHCGTTKEPTSFAPVHRAKLADGKLKGLVFTNRKLFEWVGERQPPVKKSEKK